MTNEEQNEEQNKEVIKSIAEWNGEEHEFRIVKIGDSKWQVVGHDEVLCVCISPYHTMVIVQALTIAARHCRAIDEWLDDTINEVLS